jgi:hypothetical protein
VVKWKKAALLLWKQGDSYNTFLLRKDDAVLLLSPRSRIGIAITMSFRECSDV